jgi:hypothetical protein
MSTEKKSVLSVTKFDVNVAPIEEVCRVLQKGLTQYFESVDVSVVECPDLRQSPFNLAQSGLCGRPKTADIGGVPNLVPLVQRDKYYSFKEMSVLMGMDQNAYMIGAAAGPFKEVGINSELMPNVGFENQRIENRTHFAKVSINYSNDYRN